MRSTVTFKRCCYGAQASLAATTCGAKSLVVGPIAEREIEAAARWYEEREATLGRAFIDEVLQVLDKVERAPEAFPNLRKPYRRCLLHVRRVKVEGRRREGEGIGGAKVEDSDGWR